MHSLTERVVFTGEMAEWSNAAVLKTVDCTGPGVRTLFLRWECIKNPIKAVNIKFTGFLDFIWYQIISSNIKLNERDSVRTFYNIFTHRIKS